MLEKWKNIEHENDGDTNCNWCTRYIHERFGTRIGGLGNKRMVEDHPNYSIVEISQKTKKSPGDLKKLAVTHSGEKPSANASVKNSQTSKK